VNAFPDTNEVAMIYRDIDYADILARNPVLRQAYRDGKMQRTEDYPAGYVLKPDTRGA
jgi:hypothetical protein